jgi:hypothetical protein
MADKNASTSARWASSKDTGFLASQTSSWELTFHPSSLDLLGACLDGGFLRIDAGLGRRGFDGADAREVPGHRTAGTQLAFLAE